MPDSTVKDNMSKIEYGKPKAITVVIPTYNRPEILAQTVNRLYSFLKFDGELRILIGDDGDEKTVPANVVDHENYQVTILPGPRRGLGANLNMLLKEVRTNIVLQMDDDHWLTQPLDINDYSRDLLNDAMNVGWIRLFLGERRDVYNLKTYYKFSVANYGPYWFISTESPELYIASNRPHIKHINFHKKHYGWYLEDRPLGKTEEAWCHSYKGIRNATKRWSRIPWVVIPMFGLSLNHWQHVGESWQKEGL